MSGREGYRRQGGAWHPSDAQRLLLDALAEDLTNPELATKLNLSLNTVKWHISQMLDETGCRNRDELVDWWHGFRGEDRQHGRTRALVWPLCLSPVLTSASMVLIAALALVVTLGLVEDRSPGATSKTPPEADLSARSERIQASITNLPTRTPDPWRRAWVLDVANATAAPIEFFPSDALNNPLVFGFAAWLEDGKSIFGSWAGGYGVIQPDGRLEASLAGSQGGFLPAMVALPVRGTQSLLIWRASSGNLTIINVDTKAERTIAALPDAQDLKLSPDGSTLAFTRKRPGAVDVVLLSIADSRERVLMSLPGENAAASIDIWSPDGNALLVLAGSGTYVRSGATSPQLETRYSSDWNQYIVLDMAGRQLWEHPTCRELCALVRVQWAGSGRLFVGTGGEYNPIGGPRRTDGYFKALSPPFTSEPVAFDGYVRCFSPGGRYVYWVDSDDREVIWDLDAAREVMRIKTGGSTGHCGWSQDEKLLIVSSGGF